MNIFKQRANLVRLAIAATLLLPVVPLNAQAASLQAGDTVSVSNSKGGNAYAAGAQVTIDTPTPDDVVVAGASVIVNAKVGRDVLVAGGNIMINAAVKGNIRVAGGNVAISANVDGDILVFAGTVTIAHGVKVGGDIIAAGGLVTIDGEVLGNVRANGGQVTLHGSVKGTFDGRAGTLVLAGPIAGDAVLVGSDALRVQEGARLAGNVRYFTQSGHIDFGTVLHGTAIFDQSLAPQAFPGQAANSLGFILVVILLGLVWNAVVLLVAVFVAPSVSKRAGEHLGTHLWKDLGIGALYLFATPVAAVVLMATVVGLPLGGILLVGYVVSLMLTKVVSALVIARWLQLRAKADWRQGRLFAVGLGILIALELVGLIPFAGWIFALLVSAATFGALIVAKAEAYKKIA